MFDGDIQNIIEMQRHTWMDVIKIATATQSRVINKYKNLKHKMLKCNTNIFFNKQYLNTLLTPRFADISIKNTCLGSRYTQNNSKNSYKRQTKIFVYQKINKLNQRTYICLFMYFYAWWWSIKGAETCRLLKAMKCIILNGNVYNIFGSFLAVCNNIQEIAVPPMHNIRGFHPVDFLHLYQGCKSGPEIARNIRTC